MNQNLFPPKRFASEVIGFSSTQCEASWMLLYRHISILLVKSSKQNWNRLQRDVKGYIIDIHLKYLFHDQMTRGLTPQCDCGLNCALDLARDLPDCCAEECHDTVFLLNDTRLHLERWSLTRVQKLRLRRLMALSIVSKRRNL